MLTLIATKIRKVGFKLDSQGRFLHQGLESALTMLQYCIPVPKEDQSGGETTDPSTFF